MELLAPAGSYETFAAVINAGADSVYAAGEKFGARAYAANFSNEELIRAIDYANVAGKRFYLTVNTLLKEEELNILSDYIAPFYERGLSGVIIQDFGVADLIKNTFPGLELHASTQMSIFSEYGFKELEKAGFCQAVLPREFSLKEITRISAATSLRTECFVHGALCYCVSGQCLMSSIIGARSGNRGRCAQPCRLPYAYGKKKGYPLSPRDLCVIESLNDLYKAGVYSLKIEGRMKSAEYAAGVTGIYREYLDEVIMTGGNAKPPGQKMMSSLLALGNRGGFTNGYIKDNTEDMLSGEKPSHQKSISGIKTDCELKKIKADMYLSARTGERISLKMVCEGREAACFGDEVQKANKAGASLDDIRAKLTKLGNTVFVAGKTEIDISEDAFIPASKLNTLRRETAECLLGKFRGYEPAAGKYRIENPDKTPDNPPFTEVLVTGKAQVETALLCGFVKRIILDCHFFGLNKSTEEIARRISESGREVFYALPVIFDGKTAGRYRAAIKDFVFDGYLVRAFDEIGFLKEELGEKAYIYADENIYSMNSSSLKFFKEAGVSYFATPAELNYKELLNRNNSESSVTVYGRAVLMTSRQCIIKNHEGCRKFAGGNMVYIKDRFGNRFPVKTFCDICINRIYNCKITELFSQSKKVARIGAASYMLKFTDEDAATCREVFSRFEKAFLKGENLSGSDDITYGHFKRGIE